MNASNNNQKINHVLTKLGFESGTQIAKTLQGEIWRATYPNQLVTSKTPQTAVIKITNKMLHKHSNAVVNGKIYQVQENILKEQSILKYLSAQKNCPSSIVKFKQFVESNTNYFLVEEDGGLVCLFDFIKKAHTLINAGQLEISHWQNVVKIILFQMIEAIEFIHSHNICHNDISLENFLINDVDVEVFQSVGHKNKTYVRFMIEDIKIKLCDFGLSDMFSNNNCKSDRYVGKKQYKSPEVINKNEIYDPKANDIWCFGIVVFMMVFGHPPFRVADETDTIFKYIINGCIIDVLKSWNILHYCNQELMYIFSQIFKYEEERCSLSKIKQQLNAVDL